MSLSLLLSNTGLLSVYVLFIGSDIETNSKAHSLVQSSEEAFTNYVITPSPHVPADAACMSLFTPLGVEQRETVDCLLLA